MISRTIIFLLLLRRRARLGMILLVQMILIRLIRVCRVSVRRMEVAVQTGREMGREMRGEMTRRNVISGYDVLIYSVVHTVHIRYRQYKSIVHSRIRFMNALSSYTRYPSKEAKYVLINEINVNKKSLRIRVYNLQ